MLDTFLFSVNAVMPILLPIALGYFLRCIKMGDEDFYKKLNSLCFSLFLPIMLFYNVYSIDSLGDVNWAVVVYCVFGVLISFIIGYIVANLVIKKREQKGVIIQCCFRSNYSIIGLSLAESLGGTPAVAFASVISAVGIPVFNIFAVISLLLYAGEDGEKTSVGKVLKGIVTNPHIIAIFLGIIVVMIRSFIPTGGDGMPVFTIKNNIPFLYKTLQSLSRVASPVMLIVLGAQFNFTAASDLAKEIFTGVFLRLVATPVACIGIAVLMKNVLNLTVMEVPALIAMFGTPVAVSSAVMVQRYGGDTQLAGQLVVWTSALSMFSILAIVFTLRTIGML